MLWSTGICLMCLVPRTRTVTYGPQSFAVSGPTVWNTLPSTLRVSTTTLGQFQNGLKTILFRLAYGTWLGAFVTVQAVRLAPYKYSYLLTYLLRDVASQHDKVLHKFTLLHFTFEVLSYNNDMYIVRHDNTVDGSPQYCNAFLKRNLKSCQPITILLTDWLTDKNWPSLLSTSQLLTCLIKHGRTAKSLLCRSLPMS